MDVPCSAPMVDPCRPTIPKRPAISTPLDHLAWMGDVRDLFGHNAETPGVGLDHTQGGLGRFLYGEEGDFEDF